MKQNTPFHNTNIDFLVSKFRFMIESWWLGKKQGSVGTKLAVFSLVFLIGFILLTSYEEIQLCHSVLLIYTKRRNQTKSTNNFKNACCKLRPLKIKFVTFLQQSMKFCPDCILLIFGLSWPLACLYCVLILRFSRNCSYKFEAIRHIACHYRKKLSLAWCVVSCFE